MGGCGLPPPPGRGVSVVIGSQHRGARQGEGAGALCMDASEALRMRCTGCSCLLLLRLPPALQVFETVAKH